MVGVMSEQHWADRTAAQILVVAFSDPNASTQIAHLLRLAFATGQLDGIKQAQDTVNDAFAKQRT